MSVVSAINLKGGVGKSTLVVNLAAQLARKGRVIILDLDPQQSAVMWARQAKASGKKSFDLARDVYPISLEGKKPALAFRKELDRLMVVNEVDYCLVDTPPQLSDPGLVAALLSDLVLIPVTPSPLDVWAAKSALDAARDAHETRGTGLPDIVLVPMRIVQGTVIGRDLPDILKSWGESITPPISQRVAIAESAMVGQTIDQYQPGSPGHKEFMELSNYIIKYLRK